MPTSGEAITEHLLNIPVGKIASENWGLTTPGDEDLWDVNPTTYIAGVPLTVDFDLDMGWLVEVTDRDSHQSSHLVVVVTRDGRRLHEWKDDANVKYLDERELLSWGVAAIMRLITPLTTKD